MREEHIFSEDIEIPDIVMQKAESAFEKIKMEESGVMISRDKFNNKRKKKRLFKTQAAAVACVSILAIGGVSTVAAMHHFWRRGMQGTVQATDEQQQTLTDQGVASILSESENYEELAVTNGDVTITPETVVVDDRFAFVSFSVKGFNIGMNAEPGFETGDFYLGDDPNAKDSAVNMSGSFYDGMVCDETGGPVYDDGTPVEFSEDGDVVAHYVDKEGNLEYVVQLSVADYSDCLLGKTLHVDLTNLGTLAKADCIVAMEGQWNFAIDLPEVSSAKNLTVEKDVEGTEFELDSVELSPISIKMNYTVNGEVTIEQDENGVPDFCGVVLKDGTRLPFLGNGGMTGYTDDTMSQAYVLCSFDRVIDADQVAAILVRTGQGNDLVEIPMN